MTRVTIEVIPNDAAREYAANTDGVEVYDDRIVLDGMAQHIRDGVNFLARIGMIERPKPPRPVFSVRDPDKKHRQTISADRVYPYAVISRADTDAMLRDAVDTYTNKENVMMEYQRCLDLYNSENSWQKIAGAQLLDGIKDFEDFFQKYSTRKIEIYRQSLLGVRGYDVDFCTSIEDVERVLKILPSRVRVHVETLKTHREG